MEREYENEVKEIDINKLLYSKIYNFKTLYNNNIKFTPDKISLHNKPLPKKPNNEKDKLI